VIAVDGYGVITVVVSPDEQFSANIGMTECKEA